MSLQNLPIDSANPGCRSQPRIAGKKLKTGKTDQMYYEHKSIGSQQLRFKALNAAAKKDLSQSSQSVRASRTRDPNTPAQRKEATDFLRTLVKKTPAVAKAEASPKQPAKRPADKPTGESPAPKETKS